MNQLHFTYHSLQDRLFLACRASGRGLFTVIMALLFYFGVSCTPTPLPLPEPTQQERPVWLWIQDQNQAPLANAQIILRSTVQDAQNLTADKQGKVSLSGLQQDRDYLLEISKAGYLTQSYRLRLAPDDSQTFLRFSLKKSIFQMRGRIRDLQGQALEGAVVSDLHSNRSVLTDNHGEFLLEIPTAATESDIQVHKQGYVSATLKSGQTQAQLKPITQSKRLLILLKGQVLNLSPQESSQAFHSLQTIAQQQGLESLILPSRPLDEQQLDPERDLLWIPAPATPLQTDEQTVIETFVQNGGKLLFSGEWSGFRHWDLQSSNDLLKRFGWLILNDSLSQTQKELVLDHFAPSRLCHNIQRLHLYRSASIQSLDPAHLILAYSSAAHFQILTSGGHPVWGHSIHGLGHVIVLGDSSLWLDVDSDDNGIPNVYEANNAQVWKNILSL